MVCSNCGHGEPHTGGGIGVCLHPECGCDGVAGAGVALVTPGVRKHAFPNGTVSVKIHKRKRMTLVAAREDLDEALVDRVEALEKENRILRRKVTQLTLENRELNAPGVPHPRASTHLTNAAEVLESS